MDVLIWGTGGNALKCLEPLQKKYGLNVKAFVDNDLNKVGQKISGIPIISSDDITHYMYDEILISVKNPKWIQEICMQIKGMGIAEEKIEVVEASTKYMESLGDQRSCWIRDYARYVYANGIKGNVVECGVYLGDSAKFINKYFYDRTLYLFDTFGGFVKEDLQYEFHLNNKEFENGRFAYDVHFRENNEEIALSKMINRDKCVIKKGCFPDSAQDIIDEFCFVNLDMDLYRPMLAGLKFFWDKMKDGGVILLHDYFHPELPGVFQAVCDFEKMKGKHIKKLPIGDECSIALLK